MALKGGCLCGRVRYEITGKLGPIVHCHCSTCRKAQGAAFATNAGVGDEYFSLLSGGGAVREYESSPGKFRAFCGSCGSPLWSRCVSQPEERRVRLGTLEDDPERRPLAHCWLEEKAPWFEIHDELPRFERFPVPQEKSGS